MREAHPTGWYYTGKRNCSQRLLASERTPTPGSWLTSSNGFAGAELWNGVHLPRRKRRWPSPWRRGKRWLPAAVSNWGAFCEARQIVFFGCNLEEDSQGFLKNV